MPQRAALAGGVGRAESMTERFLDMNSPARPRPYVGTPGGSPLAELQSRASTGSLHASPDTVAPPAEGASADAPLTPMVKPAREEISLALWSSGATPGSLRALGRASSAGASVSTQGGRAHAVGGRVAAVDTPSFHGDRVEVLPSSADRSADPDGPGRTPPHERASAAPAAARRRPQSTAAIVESESDDESVAKELFFRTLEARSGGPLDYATLNALDGDSDEDVAAPSPVSVQRPIQPATARERAAPPGAGRYACDSGPGAHAEATPSVGPDALSSAPTRARSRLGPTPQPPGAKLASPPRAAPWAAAPPAAAHAGGGVDDEGDAGAPAAPSSPMGGASSSSTREDHSAPHTPRGVRAAEPAAEPPFTSAPGTPAPPGAADGGSFSSRLSAAARSGAQSTSTPRRSGVRASLSPSPSARASAAPSPSAATRPSAEANKAAVERRGLEWRLKTATREHEKTERQLRERILALEGQVAARAELDEWRAEIRAGASPADLQLGPSQLAELVADIKAQERLISGYQAENEKLLRENKTLAAEAVRAKQQAAASTAAEPAPPGVRASVGDREHELNSLRLELDRAHATIQVQTARRAARVVSRAACVGAVGRVSWRPAHARGVRRRCVHATRSPRAVRPPASTPPTPTAATARRPVCRSPPSPLGAARRAPPRARSPWRRSSAAWTSAPCRGSARTSGTRSTPSRPRGTSSAPSCRPPRQSSLGISRTNRCSTRWQTRLHAG